MCSGKWGFGDGTVNKGVEMRRKDKRSRRSVLFLGFLLWLFVCTDDKKKCSCANIEQLSKMHMPFHKVNPCYPAEKR